MMSDHGRDRAEGKGSGVPSVIDNPAVAMYVAAGVALVVLGGFFWYVWSIDRDVAALRRRLDERPSLPNRYPPQATAPLRPHPRVTEEHEVGNTRT
jgi:hypothetical protein